MGEHERVPDLGADDERLLRAVRENLDPAPLEPSGVNAIGRAVWTVHKARHDALAEPAIPLIESHVAACPCDEGAKFLDGAPWIGTLN